MFDDMWDSFDEDSQSLVPNLTCKKCGGDTFRIEPHDLHGNKATCAKCNTFAKWLGKGKGSDATVPPSPPTAITLGADAIGLIGKIAKETDKAVGIKFENDSTIKWFPRSQIVINFSEDIPGGDIEITCPSWLAKKHGLKETE